jgi:ABC-type nitrate/sulfonate/bicarbonate transport system substrate-binding protein
MHFAPALRRRGALLGAGVAAVMLCAGCGELAARSSDGPPRPLTVAIDGRPNALYAALYEAQAAGDFTRGALAVKITTPPGGDSLSALESDNADVAVASEPQLLGARDGGARLVGIGALVGRPLDAFLSLGRRPVSDASALAGHTVASAATRLASAQLDTALAGAGIATARVRRVHAGSNLAGTLARGHVIATLGGPWPLEMAALERAHHSPTVLELPDAGVPTYSGLVLVVRVGEAHHQGPLLRAFLQSLTRGAAAVAANPAGAATMLAHVDPLLDAAFERAALAALVPLTRPARASQPFGYQNPYTWRAFGVWMHQHGLLSNANAGLAITDEFLPGQGE